MLKKFNQAILTVFLTLAAVTLLLSGCGGVTGSSNSGNTTPSQAKIIDLQADYVGLIPVLNGSATHSYFYIHNNGDETVYNINYALGGMAGDIFRKQHDSKLGNRNDVVDNNGFVLGGDSLQECSSIAPHSYCKIRFITPVLSPGNQNNSLLRISVKDRDGNFHHYDQVINYADYNLNLNSGVNFATSADVVANISNRRYMMAYLIAGGSNQNYSNVNLWPSDSSSIAVNQGFVNGQEMLAGELIPVEFRVNIISAQPFPVNVTPQYAINDLTQQEASRKSISGELKSQTIAAGQSLYLNTSSQTTSAMALKLGVVPIIPAPSFESNAPVIYVSNFGENIKGFTIEPASDKLKIYANSCNRTIESNASCSFRLGITDSVSGSSNVYFKVNGKTVFTEVIYYAPSSPAGEETLVVVSHPVSQVGLTPNQSSSVINLVYSNLGNYPLTNLVVAPKTSGSTRIRIIGNGCSPFLESRNQCLIQVQLIAASVPESGNVYFELTGNSGSLPFNIVSGIINYQVSANGSLMISSPSGAESSISILGDNQESAQSIFTLTNSSTRSIPVSLISLTGVDMATSLRISENHCGNEIPANSSCDIVISYGPTRPESNISGIANLTVNYANNTLSGKVNYSVMALDSHLAITGVTTSGFNGSGIVTNPYAGSGCSTVPMTVTITYKNMSDNFIARNMALNIIDEHVSPYFAVDTVSTSCGYGANPRDLGIRQSCKLVLAASRSKMNDGSSYVLDIVYPSASWNTSLGFIQQGNFTYNGSNTLYANYTQPVMVSILSPESNSRTRRLSQNLANAAGCGEIRTTIRPISYQNQVGISSGRCMINNDQSVNCVNDANNNNNIIDYRFESSMPAGDYFIMFNGETAGIQVWYNPQILLFRVGN